MNDELTAVSVLPAEVQTKITEQGREVLETAQILEVSDPLSYQLCSNFVFGLKALEEEITGKFKDPMEKAAAALQSVRDLRDFYLKPLKEAEGIAKGKAGTWLTEQKAREKREQEERDAEHRRLQRAHNEQVAKELEDVGLKTEADQLRQEPIEGSAQKMQSQIPKTGLTRADYWDVQITDENLIPREYLMLDMVKLRGVAQRMKDKTNIPGARAFNKGQMRARRQS